MRVTIENIEKEMQIQSNEMIEKINSAINSVNSPCGLSDSRIDAFLMSMEGERIARFSASGKIQAQSLSIQEGQHATSSITIKEIVK